MSNIYQEAYDEAIDDVRATIKSALENPVTEKLPATLVLQVLLASIASLNESIYDEGRNQDD